MPPVTPRRVAVITGGSSGIGVALARKLAARGWLCVVVARRRERLETVARELGGEFEVCDVGDRGDVDRSAGAIRARHPAVSLLVNNAGIAGPNGFFGDEPGGLEDVMRVNYFGSIWPTRALLPALEAAGRADVVNIVSVAGTVVYPPSGPYSASKHAQLAFSRAIDAPLRARGIRVHTIKPGFVETEGFPQRTRLRNPLLLRGVIEPEDVADHVLAALERDRRETFVPAWYRVASLVQALAPGIVSRFLERAR